MDELNLRRSLYSDPNSHDEAVQDAINSQPNINAFANELNALDKDILQALQVEVPEHLADALILKQSLQSYKQQRKSRWYVGIAASIALLVTVSTGYILLSHQYHTVADYALAHYLHERDALATSATTQYTLNDINKVSASLGASFSSDIGPLVAIEECFFDGMNSLHLVFAGRDDNVTVFVVPNSDHLSPTAEFTGNGIHGISRQYGNGHIVILGHASEPLTQWQEKLDNSIRWSI